MLRLGIMSAFSSSFSFLFFLFFFARPRALRKIFSLISTPQNRARRNKLGFFVWTFDARPLTPRKTDHFFPSPLLSSPPRPPSLEQFWLVVHYGGGLYIFGDTYVKYSMYAYSKPYCRVPAYLVGMAFGFLNERWVSDESRRPALSPTATATFLSAAGVALLACVFVPLSDYRDAESWPPWANGLFLAFSRPLWATALGVITTACALGRLPRLNAFLSSPLWTPLARLTFGAYLMHPVVIKWLAGTATASYHFSMHYIASCALFNAACAFSLAAVMWLVVERPVMNIESALRAGKRL